MCPLLLLIFSLKIAIYFFINCPIKFLTDHFTMVRAYAVPVQKCIQDFHEDANNDQMEEDVAIDLPACNC